MNDASARTWMVAGAVVWISICGWNHAGLDADETDPSTDRSGSQHEAIAGLLNQRCFECHAGESPEAGIRLDSLDLSSATRSDRELLQHVLTVVKSGQMPPADATQLSKIERQTLSSWLQRRLSQAAEQARRSGHWTHNRRLTVEEYNFTMQRLFGVDAEFGDHLPPDPVSQEGYRNNSDLLGLSPLQMECYLDAARQAVSRYVRFGQVTEESLHYHIEFEDLDYSTADRYGTRKRAPQPVSRDLFKTRRSANRTSPPEYVGPFSPIPPGRFPTDEKLRAAIPKLHQQFVAIPNWISTGEMIVRILAAGTSDRNGRFPRMRVESGITLGDGCSMDTRVLGEIDVTAPRDQPTVYEFRIRIEDVPTKGPLEQQDNDDRLSVFDMGQIFISNVSRDDQAIYALGRGGYNDPKSVTDQVDVPLETMAEAGVNFLYLDCIEIEMVPGNLGDDQDEGAVATTHAEQDPPQRRKFARKFLASFMRFAYRRPTLETEIAKKMELFDSLRKSGYPSEQALRETLAAVLVSPSFLFLESRPPAREARQPAEPTAHQLASRLSYFLWQAPPDEQLMKLADDGTLHQRTVFASQTKRMLEDSRSRRFLDDFCRQWLRLDKHPNVAVDADRYPEYDTDLAEATIQETLDYFAEVFVSGTSALDLIDSDYTLLNDRLADHYGLDPVPHGDLRKVQLPAGSIRGGLLTQASLLTMNSDGRDSHPVRRGVWLLDRLLNTPPPPPPPNVPELDREDPDFRGLSLKQQLALHRKPGTCQSCHRKIDPWGIALEEFDATGRWRDEISAGEQTTPVDAAAQLPSGPRIDGIGELKRYLHEQRREQFAESLVHHLLTYALGRSLDYADRKQVEEIGQRFAAADYRLQELVLAIVDSKAFRR